MHVLQLNIDVHRNRLKDVIDNFLHLLSQNVMVEQYVAVDTSIIYNCCAKFSQNQPNTWLMSVTHHQHYEAFFMYLIFNI